MSSDNSRGRSHAVPRLTLYENVMIPAADSHVLGRALQYLTPLLGMVDSEEVIAAAFAQHRDDIAQGLALLIGKPKSFTARIADDEMLNLLGEVLGMHGQYLALMGQLLYAYGRSRSDSRPGASDSESHTNRLDD